MRSWGKGAAGTAGAWLVSAACCPFTAIHSSPCSIHAGYKSCSSTTEDEQCKRGLHAMIHHMLACISCCRVQKLLRLSMGNGGLKKYAMCFVVCRSCCNDM